MRGASQTGGSLYALRVGIPWLLVAASTLLSVAGPAAAQGDGWVGVTESDARTLASDERAGVAKQAVGEPLDTAPPTVGVDHPATAPSSRDVELRITVRDATGVGRVTLHHRSTPRGPFVQAVLTTAEEESGLYTATLHMPEGARRLEFFVSAFDSLGNGPSMRGSGEAPIRIYAEVERGVAVPESVMISIARGLCVVLALLLALRWRAARAGEGAPARARQEPRARGAEPARCAESVARRAEPVARRAEPAKPSTRQGSRAAARARSARPGQAASWPRATGERASGRIPAVAARPAHVVPASEDEAERCAYEQRRLEEALRAARHAAKTAVLPSRVEREAAAGGGAARLEAALAEARREVARAELTRLYAHEVDQLEGALEALFEGDAPASKEPRESRRGLFAVK